MKSPVIPTALAVVSLVIAAALVLSRQDHETAPIREVAAVTKKSGRSERTTPRMQPEHLSSAESVLSISSLPADESASLGAWRQQFDELLASGETRESAAAVLAKNIDEAFGAWVSTEITAAAELTGQERLDRLVLAETRIQEGTAAIYEHLEIPGGRRIEVASDAIDALAAEIQYANFAPDHATRLALLRLIRERDGSIENAAAMADEAARADAMSALESRFEAGLDKLTLSVPLAITPIKP